MNRPITIVGGGLAGLTLGIGLRKNHVPVTVWEAGEYPRHRVCGEFISGRGQAVLARLGLRDELIAAGARVAETVAFFSGTVTTGVQSLPEPALCLSRFMLDALLAKQFQKLGGELRTKARWPRNADNDGIVHATGRSVRPVDGSEVWFGLKAHVRGVQLSADLEMHLTPDGYVGLCRLSGGVVNVCGLFQRRAGQLESARHRREWLSGEAGSVLRARLAEAEFAENSFCAVAGLSLYPQRATEQAECRVGDALTMIPPVTGNGMSVACESAEIACRPLTEFSAGRLTWLEARRQIARTCDERFGLRLTTAAWLQSGLSAPAWLRTGLVWSVRLPWVWRAWFAMTR